MKKITLTALALAVATTAIAKPVVNVSPGVKGGIDKVITETWNLSEYEKKILRIR